MTTTLPDNILANAIRTLAMDAIQKANSGHPGMPMGMADMAVALWTRHYRHNPNNPSWPNRDRFILSNGHGSMLQYALLHLTGYDLSIEDIKEFRQLHAKTPGHPEVHVTPGVETTTGPLGQGIANAVGMALAEKLLASEFNRPNFKIIDHYTYVFLGDGCLMEGVSHEAASLAGTLKLNKLIVLYDDNGISIDGDVKGWFTDDTPKRFEAYGWNVISKVDGHDIDAVDVAIKKAKQSDKPTLICCKTVIGKGSPNKAGTHNVHGAPLGEDEIHATRMALNWTYPAFQIPDAVYDAWDARKMGQKLQGDWDRLFAEYEKSYPKEASELKRRIEGQLPESFESVATAYINECVSKKETIATRRASQNAIQAYAKALPEFFGGSADLSGSNLTNWKDCVKVTGNSFGNYLSYGVREFGMSAMMNGMALYGGYIPFGGTFLTFSDYSRNALRMAALMNIRSIFVFTHDSIGVGEDGPTHEPIEQISSMRLIPNLNNWRPCDTVEAAVCWKEAIKRKDGPSALIFSRQNLAYQERTLEQIQNIAKGAYVLRDAPNADVVLIATGSEVDLAVKAKEALAKINIAAKVVSMPSTDVFDQQDKAYKESVLPKGLPRVAIEAGIADYWYKYVGLDGIVIGMTRFGESAPASALFEYFGFTVENIVAQVKTIIKK